MLTHYIANDLKIIFNVEISEIIDKRLFDNRLNEPFTFNICSINLLNLINDNEFIINIKVS